MAAVYSIRYLHTVIGNIPYYSDLFQATYIIRRSQWPSGRKSRSAAALLLGLRVRIPLGARMSVCCQCYVLPGSSLGNGLIPRPEEPYRVRCQ
jgi:hypothetical protein